jgi:hypothetical protein
MSVNYFDEEWVVEVNWEEDDLIADATGEIAKAASNRCPAPKHVPHQSTRFTPKTPTFHDLIT